MAMPVRQGNGSPTQELRKLANDCLPPQTRIWVTHFFSHFGSSGPERVAFRAALRAAGFGTGSQTDAEIGSDEEVDGDEFWHHWAFTIFPASPEELVQAYQLAQKIAAAHGVREDGWKVRRNPSQMRLCSDAELHRAVAMHSSGRLARSLSRRLDTRLASFVRRARLSMP